MQFFIDSQGTVVNLISSPVYQGSTNASELVLVAPFSSANVITATFKLPIGISTEPYLLTIQNQPIQIEGKTYNVWRVLLDGVVTQYAGKVTVQFRIYQTGYNSNDTYYSIELTTYASTFNVQKGVVPVPPPAPSESIYTQILRYLTQLNPSYSIKSVSYSSPGNEIDTDTAVLDLNAIPGLPQKGGTKFEIDNIDGSLNAPFFFADENAGSDISIDILFREPQSIGKMQFSFNQAYWSTILKITATLEDDSVIDITEFEFIAPSYDTTNVVISIDKTVKEISIIQPYAENVALDNPNDEIENKGFTRGRFCLLKVLMWAPNTTGYLTILSATDQTTIIPVVDASIIVGAENNAQASAEQATNALNEILSKAGQVGGYPVLEMIGGQPKIPSVYINLVNPTTFITIESESELDTLDAPVSSVARLVVDIDGELGTKTVIKSFVKLQEGVGSSNWALYASSYADNASNALYAEQATNALRVNNLTINGVLSEAEYNALASKQGVYFVTITPDTVEE